MCSLTQLLVSTARSIGRTRATFAPFRPIISFTFANCERRAASRRPAGRPSGEMRGRMRGEVGRRDARHPPPSRGALHFIDPHRCVRGRSATWRAIMYGSDSVTPAVYRFTSILPVTPPQGQTSPGKLPEPDDNEEDSYFKSCALDKILWIIASHFSSSRYIVWLNM